MSNKDLLFDSFKADYVMIADNLRVRRYYDLLGQEDEAIADYERQSAAAKLQVLLLRQKLAEKLDCEPDEIQKRLEQAESDPEIRRVLLDCGEDVLMMQAALPSETRRDEVLRTAVMAERAEVLTPSGDWEKIQDWTEADTLRLPKRVRQALTDFILQEMQGRPKEGAEAGKAPGGKRASRAR